MSEDQKSCRKNYSPLKNCRNDWNLEIFGIFEALLSEELMYTICSFSVLPHYPGRNSTTRMKKNVSRSSRVARFLSDLLASSAFFPGQLKAQFQICLASFYVLLKKGYGKLGQENSKFPGRSFWNLAGFFFKTGQKTGQLEPCRTSLF